MKFSTAALAGVLSAMIPVAPAQHLAATDPGVRGGPPGAGGPIDGLSAAQKILFDFVTGEFAQVHSVTGNIPGEAGNGLGPTFNLNGCGSCHAFPALGGSSPTINPQIAAANLDGARNTIPGFLSLQGPVREVRFIQNPDGSADGGVHGLFTIRGRVDAAGCDLRQLDFENEFARNNVALRIPTPVFGDGLIDNIAEETILANKGANRTLKAALGISGRENRNSNDGTITRFGWKAQNKSLLMFSGEAYNVEMGVTNELFQNEPNPRVRVQ